MYTKIITEIEQKMQSTLDNKQMSELHQVLISVLSSIGDDSTDEETERALLEAFLAAKKVEGCSDKSLRYYYSTIDNMLTNVGKTAKHITTDDLRQYLDAYQKSSKASKVTIDNIRRILSSFFSWLEEENHILKSPVRRIHKVKTGKTVKETYTDEALEIMRDSCETDRDLAMIDLLASTGMRVGEMVKLNRADIDFQERECIVSARETRSAAYILMRAQKFTSCAIWKAEPIAILRFSYRFNRLITACRSAAWRSDCAFWEEN